MKTCTKCDKELPKESFSARKLSKDGLMIWCKTCMREYHTARKADPVAVEKKRKAGLNYYYENKDEIAKKNAEKYVENREEILARNAAWQVENKERHAAAIREWAKANPEKRRAYVATYRARNPEKVKAYSDANRARLNAKSKAWAGANRDRVNRVASESRRERRATDPMFVMIDRIRASLGSAFRNNGIKKQCCTLDILGCTWPEFLTHIERQFWQGMTWENRGSWHIDHRIPISTAKTEADIIRLNHYTNLQPLWAVDNMKKSNRLDHPLGAL